MAKDARVEVVTILIAGENASFYADLDHGETRCVFHALTAKGPQRLIERPVWAFVDWVMDDLARLEMCRRLRSDTRTNAAQITMVLGSGLID